MIPLSPLLPDNKETPPPHTTEPKMASNGENVSADVTAQKISTLEALSTVEGAQFPMVFAASLEYIYQYSAIDIKNTLNTMEQDVLVITRSLLYDTWIVQFPQYKEKRMIDRRVKHLLVNDIYIIGLCIQNEHISNDLDKIFQSSTEAGVKGNSDTAYVPDLLQAIGNLTEQVELLREKIA